MEETNFLKIDELRRIKVAREILILDKAKELSEEKNKRLEALKFFYINVISSAARGKLKETAHSKILHDLLHHEKILASFLSNIVGLPENTFTPEDINYPDANRIDVSLESKTKRKFLIIENKANDAAEQEGQLFRYVEIAKNRKFDDSEIDILYLNSDSEKPPTLYSRSENGKGKEGDNNTIPISKIKIKTYKYDILRWLIELEKTFIETNEMFLKSALNQYIDYLKEYFEINDRYNEINKYMKQEILKHLRIEESESINNKIKILTDYVNDIDDLKNKVNSIIKELNEQRIDNIYEESIKTLKETNPDIKFERISNKFLEKEVIFDFEYKDQQLYGSFKFDKGQPYWAICSGTDQMPSHEILTQLRKKLDEMPIDNDRKYGTGNNKWLFYNNPSIENWEERILKLVTLLKELSRNYYR